MMKYELFYVGNGKTIAEFDELPDAVEFARDWIEENPLPKNKFGIAIIGDDGNAYRYWANENGEIIEHKFGGTK